MEENRILKTKPKTQITYFET